MNMFKTVKILTIILYGSVIIDITTSDFAGCDEETFYSFLQGDGDITNQNNMHDLIRNMHRNNLRYNQVWDALIDVDGLYINSELSVPLIYSNITIPAFPLGSNTDQTWNREHIWPKSRGVFDSGPDYTDLHHIRPSDMKVNSARGDKLFAPCGLDNDMSECITPAHSTAPETEMDSTTFLPPPNVRGDIARALFYMSTRYDGSEQNTVNLLLGDCHLEEPTIRYMGYRSQLLQWHEDDPVDETEIKRNNRVCEKWQGNRNPFVDFPELVKSYFGTPYPYVEGFGYNCTSSFTAQSPTISPIQQQEQTTGSSVSCDGVLSSGDIIFTDFDSNYPNNISFVALSDIPPGIDIYLTDNAWTGYDFRYNEGILKLIIPDEGIKQGSIFGFDDELWQIASGSFYISISGDNMHLYCLSYNNNNNTSTTPLFLSSLIYNDIGDWSEINEDPNAFTSKTSALPSSLPSNCALKLSSNSSSSTRFYYNGTRDGKKDDILDDFSNAGKWVGLSSSSLNDNADDLDFVNQDEFYVVSTDDNDNTIAPELNDTNVIVALGQEEDFNPVSSDADNTTTINSTGLVDDTNNIDLVKQEDLYNVSSSDNDANATDTDTAAVTTKQSNCEGLSSGDIIVTAFTSDKPNIIIFTALSDIPSGIELYLTTNAWTGYDFRYTEGILKLIVPNGGITQLTTFGIGHPSLELSNLWQSISDSFYLSQSGDNMHLYCLPSSSSSSDGHNNNTHPLFISSLIYNDLNNGLGGWSEANDDPTSFKSDTSALPSSLPSTCSVPLPAYQSFYYNGERNYYDKNEILEDYSNPDKWIGSNDDLLEDNLISLSEQNDFNLVPQSSSGTKYECFIHSLYLHCITFGMSLIIHYRF